MDDKPARLPLEVREQVRQSQTFFLIATDIADEVGAAFPDITDLSVAYSHGTAAVSGVCKSKASIKQAIDVVSRHPDVTEVIASLTFVLGARRPAHKARISDSIRSISN